MAVLSDDMGGITAYAAAVNRGYTGTKEEFEQLMYSYTEVAERAEAAAGNAHESEEASIEAKDIAVSAKNEAVSARDAAQAARDASISAKNNSESARDAAISAKDDTLAAKDAVMSAKGSVDETSANFSDEVTAAISDVNAAGRNQKELAKTHAVDSEAWAVGQREGADVGVSDTTYHNNSKYYAEQSELAKSETETARDTAITAKNDAVSAKNEAETAKGEAQEIVDGIQEQSDQIQINKEDISDLKSEFTALADVPVTWIDNYYLSASDGSPHSNNAYTCTDYIDLGTIRKELLYSMVVFSNIATYVLYDKDKNVVSINHTDSSSVITVTGSLYVDNDAARYVRFSTQKTDNKYIRTGRAFLEEIAPDSVATKMLKDKSVTIKKAKFIAHNEETNFIDVSALIQNRYINAYGVETSAPNWYCTDYIPLTPGKTYYKNDYVYRSYYGFYDADKNVVGCSHDDGDIGNSVGAFTLPNNAVYGRFSFNGSLNAQNLAYISINRGEPKPYDYTLDISTQYPTDYSGNDIAVFNKILCIGNSLTYGGFNSDTTISSADKATLSGKYSYPSQLQKNTGVSTTNKGDSGKTTEQWYSAHSADDLSGHDCCIIELGTNDGTWSSASATAMDSIIAKVKAENKGIKIFVSTIPRGRSYNTDAYKAINTGIKNYVSALADDDVILIDVAEYGHVIESIGYNAGHLSAYGYWRLAKDYANAISNYMHNHMDSFRFVHFIGTDYTYSS